MAQRKVFNLDAMIAEDTPRFVVWQGAEYAVEGMTGHAYLKFARAKHGLELAQQSGDEAAQFEQNVTIITMVVPGLEGRREELLGLKLPQLTALTRFVMSEVEDQTAGATAATATSEAQPGE